MKPLLHARISVNKFGGKIEDYIEIHNWFDSTKAHIADSRHRLILHNSFGIFLCEQVFGQLVVKNDGSIIKMPYIINSNGGQISVRDIAEQHVVDDLGRIPTLAECLPQTIDLEFTGLEQKLRIPRSKVQIVD
jgi:hypothetical protein